MNKIVYDLLLKLEQCDDKHNRCDYLMEHDEITYLLEHIEEKDKQLDKYKLILKALHKHFFEHEEYENNEFLRQLESCTENDMIWLKRTAGDDEE